jgi:hypothetical protein
MATTPGTTRGSTGSDERDGRFERGGTVARRRPSRLTTETKHSSKTTEFYAYIAATVGVLLAGLLTKAGDGHDDRLAAKQTWLYVSIVAGAYLISRGLAKSGSSEPYTAGTDTDRR